MILQLLQLFFGFCAQPHIHPTNPGCDIEMVPKKLLPGVTAAVLFFAAMNMLFLNTFTLRKRVDQIESQVTESRSGPVC